MKWEVYNKMSVKQKEEYNFRFPSHEYSSMIYISSILIIVFSLSYIIIAILTIYQVSLPEFESNKTMLFDMISNFDRLINILTWILIAEIAGVFVLALKDYFKQRKWLKEHGII